jgi:hypothetical protein
MRGTEAGSDRIGALDVRERLTDTGRAGVAQVHALPCLPETVERIEMGWSSGGRRLRPRPRVRLG